METARWRGEIRLGSVLRSVVVWLRAGYPNGMSERGFVPLVALLARRLSDDEVRQLADLLIAHGIVPTGVDIKTLIIGTTDELAREEDVRRVRERLTTIGWPLAD